MKKQTSLSAANQKKSTLKQQYEYDTISNQQAGKGLLLFCFLMTIPNIGEGTEKSVPSYTLHALMEDNLIACAKHHKNAHPF